MYCIPHPTPFGLVAPVHVSSGFPGAIEEQPITSGLEVKQLSHTIGDFSAARARVAQTDLQEASGRFSRPAVPFFPALAIIVPG